MSDGPWYEYNGPSTTEVNKLLTDALLHAKHKIVSDDNIKSIVDSVIRQEEQTGWSSYRGYYTFVHSDLIKKCNKKINTLIETLSREKIIRFLNNSNWISDRLYRPEDGLRWKQVQATLQSHQSTM
jgi:hypothetical protein